MFDLMEEAKQFIKINSVTNTGNIEIVEYIAKLLDQYGLQYEIQNITHDNIKQANIIVTIPGISNEEILFNTHLDTVPAGNNKLWTETNEDPFNPLIKGDKIFGLGSADTKLDFLCKLKAILKYKRQEFKKKLTFVGTFGEEMGLIGCEYFLMDYPTTENIKYAFVGEPTDLDIVYAHKGMIILNLEFPIHQHDPSLPKHQFSFKGISAHGSTPHLGENAISKAINFLKESQYELNLIAGGIAFNVVPESAKLELIESTNQTNRKRIIQLFDLLNQIENELNQDRVESFDPPFSVMNIGPINTSPHAISLDITLRLLPDRDIDCYYEQLANLMREWNGVISIKRHLHAMKTSKESYLVKESSEILKSLGLNQKLITKPALTESSLYEQYGIESIVFGPGESIDNIHKPNENNLISQMNSAVQFYEQVIEKFCLD